MSFLCVSDVGLCAAAAWCSAGRLWSDFSTAAAGATVTTRRMTWCWECASMLSDFLSRTVHSSTRSRSHSYIVCMCIRYKVRVIKVSKSNGLFFFFKWEQLCFQVVCTSCLYSWGISFKVSQMTTCFWTLLKNEYTVSFTQMCNMIKCWSDFIAKKSLMSVRTDMDINCNLTVWQRH